MKSLYVFQTELLVLLVLVLSLHACADVQFVNEVLLTPLRSSI